MELAKMNYIRLGTSAFMLAVLLLMFGCKSRQEQAGTNPPAPPGNTAASAVAPHGKNGPTAASTQDMATARSLAVRVLAQVEAGDFAAVYRDASAGFKSIGSESQFVSKFQQTRLRVGVLKNPRETSATVLPGKGIVLVYRVENERYNTDMRLSFSPSPSGKMELSGLNQHDELKQ
jgi:hypothetical protein